MNVADVAGLFFLDTNILVYSVDRSEPEKQKLAEQLIKEALGTGRGMISSQVVQEFLNVAQHKFTRPMTTAECREYLAKVLLPLCRQFPTINYYDRALVVQRDTGYLFYDALIVAAAIDAGCRTLLTEDLQHDRTIGVLTIINPFLDTRSKRR